MIKEIEIKLIKPGTNYRKFVDEAGLKELTASIKEKGVLQPIIVRPVNGHFEIVVGYRRYQSAKAAGLKAIPCVVRSLNDVHALEISLVENEQRENPHVMDAALGFKKALDLGHHTMETLCQKIGKSPAYVQARLKLAGLPDNIQKLIMKHDLPIGYALLFVRLKEEQHMKDFMKMILDDKPTVSGAQRTLEQFYGETLKGAPFDKADCLTCDARSSNVQMLFPELKGSDQCTDPKCFIQKLKDHYRPMAEKWRKEGKTVIVSGEALNNRVQERNTLRINIPGHDGPHPSAKNKCKDCNTVEYYLVESKDWRGRAHLHIGAICPNQKCYYDEGKSHPMSIKQQDDPNKVSHSTVEHAIACRNRFLWRSLPAKVEASKTLQLRLAIYHILKHNRALSDDKVRLMKKYMVNQKKTLYEAINAIPPKRLEEALRDAVLFALRYTDASVLMLAAPEAKVDLQKDFLMDEEYLRTKTKAYLLKLGNQWTKAALSEDMKKPQMLAAIMATDLKGLRTAEIDAELKPQSWDGFEQDMKQSALEGVLVTFNHGVQEKLAPKGKKK